MRRPFTARPRSELPEVDAEASLSRRVATARARSRGCATATDVSSPEARTWPPRSRTKDVAPAARAASAARSSAQPLPHAPSSIPARASSREIRRGDSSKVKREGPLSAARGSSAPSRRGCVPRMRSPHAAHERRPPSGSKAPPVVSVHSKRSLQECEELRRHRTRDAGRRRVQAGEGRVVPPGREEALRGLDGADGGLARVQGPVPRRSRHRQRERGSHHGEMSDHGFHGVGFLSNVIATKSQSLHDSRDGAGIN